MTSLANAFGTAIRRRREALGLSQEELAYRAGLHRTYISLIERGLRNASIETIVKLSKGLKTTGHELLRETEVEVREPPGQQTQRGPRPRNTDD